MLWFGLMWCMVVFFFWIVWIIIFLILVSGSYGNCWNFFKFENVFFVIREFVVNLKFDEWMVYNGWLC